jgi:hypothetical protein
MTVPALCDPVLPMPGVVPMAIVLMAVVLAVTFPMAALIMLVPSIVAVPAIFRFALMGRADCRSRQPENHADHYYQSCFHRLLLSLNTALPLLADDHSAKPARLPSTSGSIPADVYTNSSNFSILKSGRWDSPEAVFMLVVRPERLTASS